jgi:transposase-like protein
MLTSEQHRCHNEKRNFSAEFKRESAQLVVDQNTVADAASAMDVGLSTMTRWVKQLRDERQGKTPKTSPLPRNKLKSVSSGKSYNVLKWKMKY